MKKKLSVEAAFVSHWQELCRYVERRMPNISSDAADIVQLAFSRLTETEAKQDVKNTRAFLYKTAHNIAVDEIRHERVCEQYRKETVENSEAGTNLPHASGYDAEKHLLERERLRVLEQVIKKLPKKRRRIFVLNRVHGLSYDEIAAQEGMSKSAVTRHVFRALEDCRREMEDAFPDEKVG